MRGRIRIVVSPSGSLNRPFDCFSLSLCAASSCQTCSTFFAINVTSPWLVELAYCTGNVKFRHLQQVLRFCLKILLHKNTQYHSHLPTNRLHNKTKQHHEQQ